MNRFEEWCEFRAALTQNIILFMDAYPEYRIIIPGNKYSLRISEHKGVSQNIALYHDTLPLDCVEVHGTTGLAAFEAFKEMTTFTRADTFEPHRADPILPCLFINGEELIGILNGNDKNISGSHESSEEYCHGLYLRSAFPSYLIGALELKR